MLRLIVSVKWVTTRNVFKPSSQGTFDACRMTYVVKCDALAHWNLRLVQIWGASVSITGFVHKG